ncbi:hypothetical protein ACIA8C_04195 [Nocardia sp. NPDC051321]|uniref:hypothetical protein n=1 Tax=Nocardia sp. NPDC051321 TaxID=3364323 RepID=UPI0037B29C85
MIQTAWQHILHYGTAALVLGVAAAVINLILLLLWFGNIKRVYFLRRLRAALHGIPDQMLLSCESGTVSILTFDRAAGREVSRRVYTGILTWRGNPRPAKRVKSRADRQYRFGVSMIVLVLIPLVIISIWMALFDDWRLIGVTAILAIHQFVPFYIWEYPGFSELFDRD